MTLDSIIKQTMSLEDIEIFVADDGSSVNMKSLCFSYANQVDIKYRWQEDMGFRAGSARNMGIRESKATLCVFIDCGIILHPNCLREHYAVYKKHGENNVTIGYIYGNDTNLDREEMCHIVHNMSPADAISQLHKLEYRDTRESLYYELGDDLTHWLAPWVVLWSLHFSVSTSFLRDNKIYFDEYFTTWGCEDNDFGIHLCNCNALFTLARNAKAIHYPPVKSSYQRLQSEPKFRENFFSNKQYVTSKYPDNRAVQLWNEKGFRNVNRILMQEKGCRS